MRQAQREPGHARFDRPRVGDVYKRQGPAPAHENPEAAAEQVRAYVSAALAELAEQPTEALLQARYERFAKF